MRYMGSKRRLAKYLLPIILSTRTDGATYVEPFVGGGNMIEHVKGKRIGLDINLNSIKALEIIRDKAGMLPKDSTEFSEDDYIKAKTTPQYEFRAFIGFALSYGGRFFNGYAQGGGRDHVKEAFNNAQRQSRKLKGCEFYHSSYDKFIYPDNAIIYCDPPYQDTADYKIDAFNHDLFWEWVRVMSKKHMVYVSEYNAPDDFISIFSVNLRNSINNKLERENLFIHKSIVHKAKRYLKPLF